MDPHEITTLSPTQKPATEQWEPFALVSLICAVLGFWTGLALIPSIVFGHMGLSRIKRSGRKGRWMALVGLWVSYGFIALAALAIIFLMIFGGLLIDSAASIGH